MGGHRDDWDGWDDDVIGHVLDGGASPLRAEDVIAQEVTAARFDRVSARCAVVLRDPVPPGAEAREVRAAIGGVFLAAAFHSATAANGGVVLDDHMIDHDGPVPVSLRVGAGAPLDATIVGGERLCADLAALAAAEGGLPAGHLVLPAPVEPGGSAPVRPGVVEIRGPLDTALVVGVGQ
ncbi:hypothetical protein [Pseudonocardia acaciae]|uniref:hypothetical protein n=1 Tax=Pseudonocardia acaciae TaxID=551276 RepID=UPI00048ABA4C|nr:hypothetical protein [Pseudonocardia acaciae]